MSGGRAVAFRDALTIAESLVERLAPGCERIEIAGSLRRRRPEVHDIELVAVARLEERPEADLWGSPETHDLLEERIDMLLSLRVLYAREVENHRADGTIDVQTKLGPAFKALMCDGIPVDLFVVRSPSTWGVIFALRTGPGDWSTRLVTDCQAIGRRVVSGQVQRWLGSYNGWATVPTPDEHAFFAALGQPWVEPPDRRVERVRIDRAIADAAAA